MREAYVSTATAGNPIGQLKYNQTSYGNSTTGDVSKNIVVGDTTHGKQKAVKYIIKVL